MVVDSITRKPIQRPWLTLAIDIHSRCVAGFHLTLESPSATSVALCLAHAALHKAGCGSWRAASRGNGRSRAFQSDSISTTQGVPLRKG